MSKPVNRDSFYDNDFDEEFDDDGTEYELMPPDAEVIAGEQARAAENVRAARDRAKLEELYKGPEQMTAQELLDDLPAFRFRFTTKQLLIAMTVLAVAMTFAFYLNSFAVILITVFVLLAGAYGYVNYRENQRREEWYQARMEHSAQQDDEHA